MALWPSPRIVRPVACPDCRCDVWVPQLRAYRYAANAPRVAAGDVAQCARCGYVAVLLEDGSVLRVANARPVAQPENVAPAPGGTGRSGPGWLDPDMADPTHEGGGF